MINKKPIDCLKALSFMVKNDSFSINTKCCSVVTISRILNEDHKFEIETNLVNDIKEIITQETQSTNLNLQKNSCKAYAQIFAVRKETCLKSIQTISDNILNANKPNVTLSYLIIFIKILKANFPKIPYGKKPDVPLELLPLCRKIFSSILLLLFSPLNDITITHEVILFH